jgi:hypothetical protein
VILIVCLAKNTTLAGVRIVALKAASVTLLTRTNYPQKYIRNVSPSGLRLWGSSFFTDRVEIPESPSTGGSCYLLSIKLRERRMS